MLTDIGLEERIRELSQNLEINEEEMNNVLNIVYNAGGEETVRYLTDIIELIAQRNLKTELSKRIKTINEINQNNIGPMIQLIHYAYVEKNYGRIMGEAIFDTFVYMKDVTFDKNKLYIAKRKLDEIHSDYLNSPNKINSKTREYLQKFFV